MLVEQRVVVVADDEPQLDDRGIASNLVDVDEPLPLFGRLGRE